MKASHLEFRIRFFVFALIFWVAFFFSRTSHQTLWLLSARQLSRVDGATTGANSLAIGIAVSIIALLAAWLRTWATAYLHTSIVHDTRVHSHQIVAAGPFAYLRNPLYLGTILLGLAFAFLMSPWAALLEILALVFFTLRLIAREDHDLSISQGESYTRYKQAVPALLPRFTRSDVTSTAHPAWLQAIAGELWFWGFAVAVILYAATFRFDWFGEAIIVAFGVYFVVRGLMPKQHASPSNSASN